MIAGRSAVWVRKYVRTAGDAVVVEQPGVGKDLQGRFDGRQAPLVSNIRETSLAMTLSPGVACQACTGAQGRRDEV